MNFNMESIDNIKKIMCLYTKNGGNRYFIIESNNDEEACRLITLFKNSIDNDFRMHIFDYSEDIKDTIRYRNISMRRNYFSYARDYYMKDYEMSDFKDLNNTIAIFKNMDKFITDNNTAEEKMCRLKEFLGVTNFLREANYDFRSVFYVMPSWLITFIQRYCPDWRSQLSRTFSLPSSETPDSNGLYGLPDWFDENFYKNRIVKDSEGFWGCRILDSQLSTNAGNEPKYER